MYNFNTVYHNQFKITLYIQWISYNGNQQHIWNNGWNFSSLEIQKHVVLSEFFPMLTSCRFHRRTIQNTSFRSTMVVCGRRHVTYVCFIHKKRTNPLSLWTLKKNKNAQNGMKNIWYIRALENVNLVSTIISMIYPIWLKSIFRFSINREWNIDRIIIEL